MVIIFVSISIVLPILIVAYFFWQMNRLPRNRPEKFQREDDRPVVVLVGDSITQGQIGENYVSLLSHELGDRYNIVNAGVNSHLAWNLFQRLDEIIKCNPDIITILIGTNDANAATSDDEAIYYMKRMRLPKVPDREWFRDTLNAIIEKLLNETTAEIALLSIPPIGEVPEDPAFRISEEYSTIIEEVAIITGVTYLPLHERMTESLSMHPGIPKYPLKRFKIGMVKSLFKRYFLRRTWDDIGQAAGFSLHIDYLHLNTRGAQIVVNLIAPFVKRS